MKDTMNQFKTEFNDAMDNLGQRFHEMRYSAEYLDFKKNCNDMAEHSKQLFKEDIAGAGKNLGKMIKTFLSNERFTQLLNSKSNS